MYNNTKTATTIVGAKYTCSKLVNGLATEADANQCHVTDCAVDVDSGVTQELLCCSIAPCSGCSACFNSNSEANAYANPANPANPRPDEQGATIIEDNPKVPLKKEMSRKVALLEKASDDRVHVHVPEHHHQESDKKEEAINVHAYDTSIPINPEVVVNLVDERLREDPDLPDLPLPVMWTPPVGQQEDSDKHLDTIGSKTEWGKPTIYAAIASYRDHLCVGTIANLFQRAAFPSRIYVGVVEQNRPEDVNCVPKVCEDSSTGVHPLSVWKGMFNLSKAEAEVCMRRKQIRLYKLPAADSLGPTYARYIGYRMYRGEYFTLQVDAHTRFVNNWDRKLITQWNAAGNERAVISAYPAGLKGSIDANGDVTEMSRGSTAMCDFTWPRRDDVYMLQHKGSKKFFPREVQKIGPDESVDKVVPMLHAFWGAGQSFARGHFIVRVPYDPHTPMVFHGEEILTAVKAWTRGYDFYAPAENVLFHPYVRKNKPVTFWENKIQHPGAGARGKRRIRKIMDCGDDDDDDDEKDPLPDQDSNSKKQPNKVNLYEIDKEEYNLGKDRPIEWFNQLYGVDCKNNLPQGKKLCPFVTSGKMHYEYTKHMRSNKLGIDYSKVPEIIEFEKNKDKEYEKRSTFKRV